MKYINLTQNKKAIIDNEDFNFLNQWKWCFSNGYAVRNIKQATFIRKNAERIYHQL